MGINNNRIRLSVKIIELVKRGHITKKQLSVIDSDIEVAKEKLFLFVSFVKNSYYDSNAKLKSLSAQILMDVFGFNYKRIIDILLEGTKLNGPILIVDNNYDPGVQCKSYGLTEFYLHNKQVDYFATTEWLTNHLVNKVAFVKSSENLLIQNTLTMYSRIELPTELDIKNEAVRIIKNKELLSNGKKLVRLAGHARTKFEETVKNKKGELVSVLKKGIVIAEESLERFTALTKPTYILPSVSDAAGGRCADALTLMPSWIRKLIKLDGELLASVDYKCLHPNLIMMLFSGEKRYLTHQEVATKLKLSVNAVKQQHLSFFNDESYKMKNYKVYDFYKNEVPGVIEAITSDKDINGSKHTSRICFETETLIMTEVLRQLNNERIEAVYVYDCFMTKQCNAAKVAEIMNRVALKFNVYTVASIS